MNGTRVALPRLRTPFLPRRRRPSRRAIVLGLVLVALLGSGWLWLRDSSLVAVRRVTITGLAGPGADPLRAALNDAALDMTTLHVRGDALRRAARAFPIVKDVHLSAQPPHGLLVAVEEQVPVVALVAGGRRLPVAADGSILPAALATEGLAELVVPGLPAGTRLPEGGTRADVAAVGAAPAELRGRVAEVAPSREHGLTLRLRAGPALYFGGTDHVAAKWAAATRVLADPRAAGASYVDVTVPEHPAAGGLGAGGAPPGGSPADAPAQPPIAGAAGRADASPAPTAEPGAPQPGAAP